MSIGCWVKVRFLSLLVGLRYVLIDDGAANFYQRLSMRHRHRSEWVVHNSTPAPASSDLVCLMATNAGVVRVLENETMSLVSSPKNNPKEMFDMDFQQGNHNVVLAGGRASRLWMADLRSPKWSFIRHASSIARVRSVNEHQVVACGLQSSMCLYDLRFVSQRPNGMGPLVSFTGYRNEAHVHVGFDVCTEAGVVAAAQEDGTVGLFSLESGRRVRCEAMGFGRGRVVRALMFGEGGASLWIGEGPGIAKYAFGETSGW